MAASPYARTPIKDGLLGSDQGNKSIRLLKLHPGGRHHGLRGTLSVASLDQQPFYEALSYTWGATTQDQAILLNDEFSLRITDNLSNALHRLRHRFRPRVLWVDAICINQADIGERSEQVAIMGQIYCQADTVLVWLGETHSWSWTDTILTLYAKLRPALERIRPSWTRLDLQLLSAYPFRQLRSYARTFLDEPWHALVNVIVGTRPAWHERVWVVQEFMLARRSCFCFGPYRLSNDDVVFWTSRTAFADEHDNGYKAIYALLLRVWAMRRKASREAQSLAEVFALHTGVSATDPRDKVYGMLGLVDADEARRIGTDYHLHCVDVFARATFECICTQSGWRVLGLAMIAAPRTERLPSWAVDFTLSPDTFHWQQGRPSDTVAYPWPRGSSANTVASLCGPQSSRLVVKGLVFDTISECLNTGFDQCAWMGKRPFMPLALLLSLVIHSARKTLAPDAHLNSKLSSQATPQDHDLWSGVSSLLELLCKLEERAERTPDVVFSHAFAYGVRLWNYLSGYTFSLGYHESHRRPETPDIWAFLYELRRGLNGVCLFATKTGFVGAGPPTVRPGDVVALWPRSEYPVVLRRDGAEWTFQGLAWIHAIMRGELESFWDKIELQETKFVVK